ncbi:MAG: ABC transporter permease [Clostridia bacterium]
MDLRESFSSAIDSIRSNSMRSLLTMLGIIIGIGSVIAIVALGNGLKSYVSGQFESVGSNSIQINITPPSGVTLTKQDYFTITDIAYLKSKLPEIKNVSFLSLRTFGKLSTEKKDFEAVLSGIDYDYTEVEKLEFITGHMFTARDVATKRKVALIYDNDAIRLFKTVDCLGKKIIFKTDTGTISLSVVGVVKNPQGGMMSMFGDNVPLMPFAPISLGEQIFPSFFEQTQLYVKHDGTLTAEQIGDRIIRILEKTHHNSGLYVAQLGFAQVNTINDVLSKLTLAVGAIAAISLLVGGIGVMNIMLVSVTERTREIGIRKAIGAKKRDIQVQFLLESVVLCLIGGILGMLLGFFLAWMAGTLFNIQATITFGVVALTVLFSSAIGIFFGLYPATKAAKLDPIEALRYE